MRFAIRLQAWLLSSVATRLVRAPAIALTQRTLHKPETVSVPTRHGPVPCLVTRPAADAPLASRAKPPVHINFHGGAFLLGAPQQDEHIVNGIAGEVGAVVVNVDYSRAPRVRFPHAHEECFDVLQWVAACGPAQGWDGSSISISGTSAGGNLALGVLEQARRNGSPSVCAGVLFVPAVDVNAPPESYVSDIQKPFVSPSMVRLLQETYFAEAPRRTEVLASPGLADEELRALPPLLIFSAEHDSVRPQIERFVHKARARGASVDHVCVVGVDHDFQVNTKVVGKVMPDVMERTASFLIQIISEKGDTAASGMPAAH